MARKLTTKKVYARLGTKTKSSSRQRKRKRGYMIPAEVKRARRGR